MAGQSASLGLLNAEDLVKVPLGDFFQVHRQALQFLGTAVAQILRVVAAERLEDGR